MIELATLGRVSIRREGVELETLLTHRQKFGLLVYLALEGPVNRDRLLALFWPERSQERARHSLSQALYALRRDLQEECVQMSGDAVTASGEGCTLDARELEAAAEQQQWEKVIELYRGPFLDQFSLSGAPEFDDWASRTRSQLARLARRAFREVVEARLSAGGPAAALATAVRWAELEPLEDEAQHTCIALLAQAGDRTAALKQYNVYRERLAAELQVEPLEATTALVQRIRNGEVPEFRTLEGATRPAIAEAEPDEKGVLPATAADEALPEPSPAPSLEALTGWSALLKELRSRQTIRIGLVYLGAAWIALEFTSMLTEQQVIPQQVFYLLLFFLAVGFPFTLILAWVQGQGRMEPGPLGVLVDQPTPSWVTRVQPRHLLAALTMAALFLWGGFTLFRTDERPPGPAAEGVGLDPSRVAVLPVVDQSADQSLGNLAERLTNDLIYELRRAEPLSVVPRIGVNPYRDAKLTADSIGQQLGAGTLVFGTLTKSGTDLRVNLELVDANRNEQYGSWVLLQSRTESLAAPSKLAREMANTLLSKLGKELELRRREEGTESQKALELVRRADQALEDAREFKMVEAFETAEGMYAQAENYLGQAEALDSDWVEPIVLQGWVAFERARLRSESPSEYDTVWIDNGLVHAERALNLSSGNPAALELRGWLLFYEQWITGSSETLRRAERDLQLVYSSDPTRARALVALADLYRIQGRLREARIWAERALAADPFLRFDDWTLYTFAQTLLDVGEYDDAVSFCEEGWRRFEDPVYPACLLVAMASADGPPPDVTKAWQLLQAYESSYDAEYHPAGQMLTGAILARAEHEDSARSVLRRARDQAESFDEPYRNYAAYYEANARLLLGDTAQALDLLERRLQANPDRKSYTKEESWWKPLHGHPRFEAMVAPDSAPGTTP